MTYDKVVYFQRIKPGEYNSETGNYEDDVVEETKVWASVMDTGAKTLNLVYGKIVQGSLTIHLMNHFKDPFDRIRVGEKVYRADFQRKLPTKHTFVVSEVQ